MLLTACALRVTGLASVLVDAAQATNAKAREIVIARRKARANPIEVFESPLR